MNERGSMKFYNTTDTKDKISCTVPRWYRSWIPLTDIHEKFNGTKKKLKKNGYSWETGFDG